MDALSTYVSVNTYLNDLQKEAQLVGYLNGKNCIIVTYRADHSITAPEEISNGIDYYTKGICVEAKVKTETGYDSLKLFTQVFYYKPPLFNSKPIYTYDPDEKQLMVLLDGFITAINHHRKEEEQNAVSQ